MVGQLFAEIGALRECMPYALDLNFLWFTRVRDRSQPTTRTHCFNHRTSQGSCSGDCERKLCCIRCDGFTVFALLHRVEMASTAPVAGQWYYSPRLCIALTAADVKCGEQE